MAKRGYTNAEELIVKNIHKVKEIKKELEKLEDSILELPNTEELKANEKKTLNRLAKNAERKRQEKGKTAVSFFSKEDLGEPHFLRSWKEFNRELQSLQEYLSELTEALKEKGIEE